MRLFVIYAFALIACISNVHAAKHLKRIKSGKVHKKSDDVHIIVNSVGPFNNPMEKYRFYKLPFCKKHQEHEDVDKPREGAQRHKQRLGEKLAGDRRESSPYAVKFKEDFDNRVLCEETLTPDQLKQFGDAILNSYFFEMYVEDLAMWGYIGDVENEDLTGTSDSVYLYPHHNFIFGINNNQFVSALITTDVDKRVDISDTSKSKKVAFTYSVKFVEEEIKWKERMNRYTDSQFTTKSLDIHWLSIINSFVLVLLLTAFLTIILLRVLKNDFSKYMELDEETMDEEESGWKLIHGDVFRFPENSSLFCAAFGTGTQLLLSTFLVLSLSVGKWISMTRRGSILTAAVVVYTLTSIVGGYISAKLYFQMNGKAWARCVVLTTLLFPLPVFIVFSVANSIAIGHGSSSALPFGVIVTIGFLYSCISAPLTLFGGLMAKRYGKKDMEVPTRTTRVAREIPTEIPFYKGRQAQMLISGFLPFSAIYIELHYIFASMWGHHVYTLFGILFFAFVLLVVVTSAITVALLYFQLSREDHRWWWVSFTNGGMIGLFVYAYSFYYYFQRSGMTGLLQTSFYFGYMGIVCFALFLMLGSAAFRLSLIFVKYIYSRVKCD